MADDLKEIQRIIGNLDPKTGYTARVRAFNRFGIPSDWSEAISFDTGDINIPGAIATVYLAAATKTIFVQWSAVTDPALNHYEIYVSTTPNFTPSPFLLVATPVNGSVALIEFYWNGSALVPLLIGKTYYVQMYWVDGSNNKTLMGTEVSATTGITVNEDGIQAALISADRITTGTLLAAVTLSGVIKTGDSGARMEIDSAGFRGYAIDGITKKIEYKTSDGSLTVVGNISGGTIDIGGADATSFHVDASGNMWLGAAVFGSAPFSVTSTGSMTVSNATFTGGTVSGSGVSGTTVTGTNTVSNSSGNILQSGNFVAGTSGWVIKGNGDVEFNAGTFRGAISGASIDIGGADSTSMHVDTTGNMWLGNATFSGAPFTVSSTGALTATNGTFTGTLTGTINNASGTISGGTLTGALIQTGSSVPKVVIKNTLDSGNFNSVYQMELYSARSSDFAPAKIYADWGTIITSWTYLHLESPKYGSSASAAYIDIVSLQNNNSSIEFNATNISTKGNPLATGALTASTGNFSSTLAVSSTSTFTGQTTHNGGINIASSSSLLMNGNSTIDSSRQFVGSGGVNTSGNIDGNAYSINGSTAINTFVGFVGVGGVNTSGSISTSSSATSATLFITSIPTTSAFTAGMNGSQLVIQSSTEKIKKDITTLSNSTHDTSNVYKLIARSFNMKGEDRIRPDDTDKWVGLVVEEVEQIDQSLTMRDKEYGYADIDWRALSTYMLVEMQKMRKEIDTMKKSK